jgi:hypothetical protein
LPQDAHTVIFVTDSDQTVTARPEPGAQHGPALVTSLPARDGAAARLARLLRERGLSADIKPVGRALVLTVRNPAVPFGALTQQVALVPDGEHGEAFVWLFEGARRGAWDTEPIGPAAAVEAAADRLARVLTLTDSVIADSRQSI